MQALPRHRLLALGLDPAAVDAMPIDDRVRAVHRAFVTRLPYETLSRLHRWREHPSEPRAWTRTTDRLLRENAADGAGGTSFELAHALADVLRCVGAVAHTALGRHLRRHEPHAAVLVFREGGVTTLHEIAYFVPDGVPVRPFGEVRDALFSHVLVPDGGPGLTLVQRGPGGRETPLYTLVAVPARADSFLQAWTDACRRHRETDVVLARRRGDSVVRYFERDGRLEVTTPAGLSYETPDGDLPADLHRRFGLSESLLRSHFSEAG